MKKIILILFLFLLCISCYFIYHLTKQDKLYITSIGDELATYQYIDNSKIKNYNKQFTDTDLKTTDLLNNLKYNYGNNPNIHQVLKKSDILIISIGINDIYYKLNDDTKEIYTYLNNIIDIYEEILEIINKYNYQKVYILSYYSINKDQNDIINYINYKLLKLANSYHYTYLDLNKIISNNPKYLKKEDNYHLNNLGFKQISILIVENLKKYDII